MSVITINQTIKNAPYFAAYYGLSVGDVLVRPYAGVAEHYAVFVGYRHGKLMLAENQRGFGVRYISLQKFLNECGGEVTRIRRFRGNPDNVLERVDELWRRNEPYNLVSNNCEHFANYVTRRKAYSKQVQTATLVAGGLGLLAIWAFSKR